MSIFYPLQHPIFLSKQQQYFLGYNQKRQQLIRVYFDLLSQPFTLRISLQILLQLYCRLTKFPCRNMALKLASGSYDGTIRFWDPSTGSTIPNQTIKTNIVANHIEISQDKSKLIVGMNNSLKIYDLNKPDHVKHSFDTQFKGNVTSVGFKNRDKQIYSSCEDGFIKIFDLKVKKQVKSFKQNKPINCAVLHPNQNDILSGDEAGYFRIWDIPTQKQMWAILGGNEVGIRSISVSHNGQNIIYADSKGWVQPFVIQENKNLKKCTSIHAHDDYILNVQISSNNKFLATCSADKKIKLFKISSSNDGKQKEAKIDLTEFKTLKGHFKWVWDCHFSCDSAYLISCSTDSTIKLWDVQKGELVQTLKGHEKGVISLALNDITTD